MFNNIIFIILDKNQKENDIDKNRIFILLKTKCRMWYLNFLSFKCK